MGGNLNNQANANFPWAEMRIHLDKKAQLPVQILEIPKPTKPKIMP